MVRPRSPRTCLPGTGPSILSANTDFGKKKANDAIRVSLGGFLFSSEGTSYRLHATACRGVPRPEPQGFSMGGDEIEVLGFPKLFPESYRFGERFRERRKCSVANVDGVTMESKDQTTKRFRSPIPEESASRPTFKDVQIACVGFSRPGNRSNGLSPQNHTNARRNRRYVRERGDPRLSVSSLSNRRKLHKCIHYGPGFFPERAI